MLKTTGKDLRGMRWGWGGTNFANVTNSGQIQAKILAFFVLFFLLVERFCLLGLILGVHVGKRRLHNLPPPPPPPTESNKSHDADSIREMILFMISVFAFDEEHLHVGLRSNFFLSNILMHFHPFFCLSLGSSQNLVSIWSLQCFLLFFFFFFFGGNQINCSCVLCTCTCSILTFFPDLF